MPLSRRALASAVLALAHLGGADWSTGEPCSFDVHADVPIVRLWRCPPGLVGYDCEQRLDLLLSFLPDPQRWRREWSDVRARRCQQRALDATFDALVASHGPAFHHRETRTGRRIEHIFEITNRRRPCTVGKMLHQFTVANHAALTDLRAADARMLWQVRDDAGWHYTRNGTICTGLSAGWFCLWQPFFPPPTADAGGDGSSGGGSGDGGTFAARGDGVALEPPRKLWPPAAVGEDSAVQYVLMGMVMRALTRPTDALLAYLRPRLRAVCADGQPADMSAMPPRCPGRDGPAAAVQVRHGDSCEGPMAVVKGPRNMMIRGGKRLYRYCYAWSVYRAELLALRDAYGLQTVYIATDDPGVIAEAAADRSAGLDWMFVDWPREQLARPKPWVEFRANLDEHVPLSLAAELELLGHADVFVGSFGSQVGRSIYYRMLSRVRAGTMPPFVSVDGYGLCCDFREDCTEADIVARERPLRTCILRGGSTDFLYVCNAPPPAIAPEHCMRADTPLDVFGAGMRPRVHA
ncbi:hypothetical protein KFE25_008083 [Diacronema lutheri]|uniref:Uncharacterized protein n=3 Tax=Diacronema lutheri TaxID=2081491 RepID=A0A8J6CBM2_DIALT|nr:hypothetical protein KFE25_008083 [Diacronema lutheri]